MVLASTSPHGSPSPPASFAHRSRSSPNTYRHGTDVLSLSRLFDVAIFFCSGFVSRIIGAILRFEMSFALSTVGSTNIAGPGSMSIIYAIMFISISVFPTWDDATTAIRCTRGSVNASMISFRYGVLDVRHGPASALFSADSLLYLSDQSDTVSCSGGLKFKTAFLTLLFRFLIFSNRSSFVVPLLTDPASSVSYPLSIFLWVIFII